MTEKKKGVDYSHVTPELAAQVREVVAEGRKHRYSVSRVFTAHNAAFGLNEPPSSCNSCLINRVRNLSQWLKGYEDSIGRAADGGKGSYDPEPEKADDATVQPPEPEPAQGPEPEKAPATVTPKTRKPRVAAQPTKDEGNELM